MSETFVLVAIFVLVTPAVCIIGLVVGQFLVQLYRAVRPVRPSPIRHGGDVAPHILRDESVMRARREIVMPEENRRR